MSGADDDTPHQYTGAEAEIPQTHADLDGAIHLTGQAGTEAEVGNAGSKQERGDELYPENVGGEVAIKSEPEERVQEGENSESIPNNLPLNLQLASNTHWEQRGTLGWDSQDGNLQRNIHHQDSTVTSTNSEADCGFLPQFGVQVQQQARGTSINSTRQQQKQTQFAPDHFGQGFGRPNMSLRTPSPFLYQTHTTRYGCADELPSMNTPHPNTAFGQRGPMPSAFMPPAFMPPTHLTHSNMPIWAHQSSLPPSLDPFSWSDPLSTNHNINSVRDFHDQSGIIEDAEEVSDDDEPLVTRVQRHRSVTLSASDRSPYPRTASVDVESPIEDFQNGPDENWHGEANAHNIRASSTRDTTRIDRPKSPTSSEPEAMSWRLPPYEAVYVPPTTQDDLPLAKVSIPGLVREELLLSPDHTTQEFILFQQVFLPAQQALTRPDPEPAHAVLNFHTIAVLVVEAFTQYEIGDEVSHGASPRAPTAPDTPFSRQHSAKDADVDAIFFAVIDRWRAGLESNKQPLRLIRGAQEFCDIALDVIHYIKEHGLEASEQSARKQRKDKGVPRGPRKKDAQTQAEPSGAGAKGKRKIEAEGTGYANANTLSARKKVKSDKGKGKEKTRAKPGPKPKTATTTKAASRGSKAKSGGITVIQWKK
jgi:hypothetical protein